MATSSAVSPLDVSKVFVSNMAMLMMTFLPGLHFVRGGEKFPRVQLSLPLLLLVAQMCVLMFRKREMGM